MSGYYCQPCDIYDEGGAYPVCCDISSRNRPSTVMYRNQGYDSEDESDDLRNDPVSCCRGRKYRSKSRFIEEIRSKVGCRGNDDVEACPRPHTMGKFTPRRKRDLHEGPIKLNLQTVFKRNFQDSATLVNSTCSSLTQTCKEGVPTSESECQCKLIHRKSMKHASVLALEPKSESELRSNCKQEGTEKCECRKANRPESKRKKQIESEKLVLKPRQSEAEESDGCDFFTATEKSIPGSDVIVGSIATFILNLFKPGIMEDMDNFDCNTSEGRTEDSLRQQEEDNSKPLLSEYSVSRNNSNETGWNSLRKCRNTDSHHTKKKKRRNDAANSSHIMLQPFILLLFFIGMYVFDSFLKSLS